MAAIVVCAACSTKLKVPEGSSAKALKCPKCKGVVPVADGKPKAGPPPPKEEEFEVNEPVEERDEEFEVNEAAGDDEEHEVNESVDDEGDQDESDADDDSLGEDSALAELGFLKCKDVFKKANIPDGARKAFEKIFVKNEKPLWAGRPDAKIIESKAWIGLIVGPIAIVVGLSICLGTSAIAMFAVDQMVTRLLMMAFGGLFGVLFPAVGVLAIIFRKRIGGNVQASYLVTNKRAYICDGSGADGGGAVRAFTPQQLEELRVEVSAKFEGAGDLIFAYDFMGEQGVMASKEELDRLKTRGHGAHGTSTAVGFLSIADVEQVRKMIDEVLIEPMVDKQEAKAKAKKKKQREKENYKPFG